MKHIKIYITVLSIFLSFSLFAQQKRALIVGISEYPSSSQWSEINSDNDVDILKSTLHNIGFSINILENQDATKKGIFQALKKLHKDVHEKDSVLIHFSCHGQLYLTEERKLIESLIPYDAQKYYKKDVYQGEKHLLDYELGAYLEQIRKKVGTEGILFVTVDACHSGDIVRAMDDEAPVRGTNSVFTSDVSYVLPNKMDVKKNNIIQKQYGMSQFCAVYACQPYQRNFEFKVEDKYYGSLSYAFYNAVRKYKTFNPKLLAREIVRQMDKTMRKQNPYFESTFTF